MNVNSIIDCGEALPESYIIIEVKEERTTTPVLISDKIDRVILRVLTLEALAFKVNPRTGELEKLNFTTMKYNNVHDYFY
jgi:hypothetical protein